MSELLIFLPVSALSLLFVLFRRPDFDWRKSFVLASILWGAFVAIDTEILGAFNRIAFRAVVISWLLFDVILVGAVIWQWERLRFPCLSRRWLWPDYWLPVLCIGGLLGLLAAVAYATAPNITDGLSYHMPRVMHWIQNGNLRPYPTNITRQLHMPPFSEFTILHAQLLTGGDRFATFASWCGLAGSAIVVSYIAKLLGARIWGQFIAAAACVSIPMGVLQSVSLHNDLPVSFWLCCFVAIVVELGSLRERRTHWRMVLAAGAAGGLAVLSKGTGYLFVAPFAIWLAMEYLVRQTWGSWRKLPDKPEESNADALVTNEVPTPTGRAVVLAHPSTTRPHRLLIGGRVVVRIAIAAGILLGTISLAAIINSGFWWRNYSITGSPLGSGQESWRGGTFEYANASFDLKTTASNLIRNTGLQLTLPHSYPKPATRSSDALEVSQRFNKWLSTYELDLHRRIEIDPFDRNTTWQGDYSRTLIRDRPGDWLNEAGAGNPLHFALWFISGVVALLVGGHRWRVGSYFLASVAGYVLFSVYLRWQPFHTRLMLPLLILGCALIGLALDRVVIAGSSWIVGKVAVAFTAVVKAARGRRRTIDAVVRNGSNSLAATLVALCLVASAVPYALYNFWNPILSPQSPDETVFRASRSFNFARQEHWRREQWEAVADRIVQLKLDRVGFLSDGSQPEYVLWKLLRDRNANVHIEHIRVTTYAKALVGQPPFDQPEPEFTVTFEMRDVLLRPTSSLRRWRR